MRACLPFVLTCDTRLVHAKHLFHVPGMLNGMASLLLFLVVSGVLVGGFVALVWWRKE